MLTITFANGNSFEYLEAFETEEHFNGSLRRTLTVHCVNTATDLTALNALLSNEDSISDIIMRNSELSTENIYSGYVLKLEVGVKSLKTANETPEVPAMYENRLIFKLGQRTYIEQQLKALGYEVT